MGSIKFPITVKGIEFGKKEIHIAKTLSGAACGDLVSVRPCDPECEGKTYLGILLGEFPLSLSCSWDAEKQILTASTTMHNPAMFVPDLKRVVWGCGSFWSRITSEEQLRKITDEDISNVWYIKALRESAEKAEGPAPVQDQG